MPTVKSDILSEIRGKLGGKNFRTLVSGLIVMGKVPGKQVFTDENDRVARDTRIRGFGGSGHIVPVIIDALRLGFVYRERGKSAGSVFMELNANTLCAAIPDEQGKLTRVYNFKEMVIADGPVQRPAVTATVDERTVTFVQEKSEVERTYNTPKDRCYALVLDSINEVADFVQLRDRGEGGSTSVQISADMAMSGLYVYVFAMLHTGKRASKSLCIACPPGAEELAAKVREHLSRKTGKMT